MDFVSRHGTRWTPVRSVLPTALGEFEFLFFLKAVGESPFCSSHFKLSGEVRACNHEAAVPVAQALREERTHGRARALWEELVKLTQVSSYPPSWEVGKDFAQPRCTPHHRARGTGECTMQPSCHDSCTLWPCRCVLALAKLGLIRSPTTCLRPRLLRLGLRTAIHLPLR